MKTTVCLVGIYMGLHVSLRLRREFRFQEFRFGFKAPKWVLIEYMGLCYLMGTVEGPVQFQQPQPS